MLKAVVAGRLGADSEIKETQNGRRFLSFSVATDRLRNGERQTMWIRCQLWDTEGGRCAKLAPKLVKGTTAFMVGDLWVEKNGEYLNIDLTVKEIEFSQKPDAQPLAVPQQQQGYAPQEDTYGYDIPF